MSTISFKAIQKGMAHSLSFLSLPSYSILKIKPSRLILSFIFFILIDVNTYAQTAYAVWCESDSTLYYTYRSETLIEGGTFVPEGNGENSAKTISKIGISESDPIRMLCKTVIIEKSYKNVQLGWRPRLFYDMRNLTSIIGLENLNTGNVTSMKEMFYECRSLSSELDLSSFDTSKVTDMSFMFYDCKNLTCLILSSFDTSKVTNMDAMFSGCSSLTSLDLSNFDTSKVTYMDAMFSGCSSLTSLDLSNFDTSSVTNMQKMFSGCKSITNLSQANFNTSKVTYMGSMFQGCSSLASLDLSHFDTSNVTSMGEMFSNCSSLKSLAISSFSTSKVTSMARMFYNCNSLVNLDLSNFETSKVTSMEKMFYGCNGLANLNLSSFETSLVTNMQEMFYGCNSLTNLDLSNFETSKVTSMEKMFSGCNNLEELTLSEFETSSVTNMQEMFSGCNSLVCLDLYSFNTGNVTNMKSMFMDCQQLRTINVSDNWSTVKIKGSYGSEMFTRCFKITGGNGTTYHYLNVDYTFAHIDEDGNPGYLTAGFPQQPIKHIDAQGVIYTLNAEKTSYSVTGHSFDFNPNLTIPDSLFLLPVSSIGAKAFYDSNLESISLPEGLKTIGTLAFQSCQLTNIYIPSSVTDLNTEMEDYGGFSLHSSNSSPFSLNPLETIQVAEGNAIYDSRNKCNAIIETSSNTLITGCISTIIPENVNCIGRAAFLSCQIDTIVIPQSVSVISDDAFYGCSNLLTVIVESETPSSLGSYAFDSNTYKGTLLVPKGCVESYKNADGWIQFRNIIENCDYSLPDLIISSINADKQSVNPGEKLTVSWKSKNIGKQAITGSWDEQLSFILEDGSVSKPLSIYHYDGPLDAESELTHQEEIILPKLLGIDGQVKLQVEIICNETTGEPAECMDNNILQSEATLTLNKELTLELTPSRVEEGENVTISMKLNRSGSWTDEQAFNITSTTDNRIFVPNTISIPAGQSGVVLPLSVAENDILDNDSIICISVAGNGYESIQEQIVIIDDEFPALEVSTSRTEITEGEGFQLTITAAHAPTTPTSIMLTCDNSTRFDFPSRVVLPAGETSISINITAVDDNDIADTLTASFTASANRYEGGEALILLNDNDMPEIVLQLAPAAVRATAGANAIIGTITRKNNLNGNAVIVLSDDSNGMLSYSQQSITLKPGVSEARFNISVNSSIESDQTVTITAAVYVKACDCTAKSQSAGSTSQSLTLLAGSGTDLMVEPTSTSFSADSDDNGITVTLDSPSENETIVYISSDFEDYLDYEHTVMIPSGETSIMVPVTWKMTEGVPEGKFVTFTVTSEGHAPATSWAIVDEKGLPDAVITSFTVDTAEAEAESEVDICIVVKNAGKGVLDENTSVQIKLSGDTYPVRVSLGQSLSSGETATVNTTYILPRTTGNYEFQAIVNANGNVEESLASNNVSQSIPITVKPNFEATAHTDKQTYAQGEVITVTGKATGSKSANADVEAYFINDGMRQSVIAKTDSEGNYTAEFLPHDGTSGHFAVGACYPGEGKTAAMAEVNTYGLSTKMYHSSCQIAQGSSISGSFSITNPGILPQTGISVASQGLPEGCEISIPSIERIEGGQTIDVPYTINASDKCVANDKNQIKLTLTTNEGSKIEHCIDCAIAPAQGCLETDSPTISTTMTLATARDYPITIWNKGQAQTGIIILSLPSWIQSLTPRELPSLAPDDSTKVILRIMPSEKMALNIPLEGHVGMNCAEGTGLAIDLKVTPVSEQSGTLTVDVTDYLTYCTAEKPHLQGAEVRITNRATQAVIAEGITGADGKFSVVIPEGWYELNVSADYHEEYNHDILVDPGVSQEEKVFLEFNGIEADLEVRETEVEDEYSIVTKMTFEAQVPPPTIEVIWPVERPRIGTYFPVTIVNRGLIQLFDVQTDFYVSAGNYDMEILGNPDIDTLAAQQSVVLYAKLLEKQASSRKNASAIEASVDNSCLMLNGSGSYCYECGDVVKTSIQPAPFATWGTCTVPNSPGGGNSGGGNSGGGSPDPSSNDSWPPQKDEFACDLPKFKLVAIDGDWTSIPLKGIATDGMSKLKVVLDVNKEEEKYKNIINNITDIEWSMSEDVGNLQNVDKLEGLVYTAPESFSWEGETSHNIILNLSCKIKGEPFHQDVTIELIRIPVVLVHGLNSDPSCWNSMIDYLGRHGYRREMLKAVNYQRTHNDSFETNKEVVGEQTKDFLKVLGLDYACSSVDVVAHSMGGLLTKKYIQNHASDSRIFHKLITINTPHGGSQLGNLMNDIKVQFVRDIHYKKEPVIISLKPLIIKWIEPHHPLERRLLRSAYSDREFSPSKNNVPNNEELENTDISQGAVYDLSVGGKAIESLNVAGLPNVNCHAIVTSSFLNQDEGKLGLINIFRVAGCLGYTSIQDFANDLYNGDANDYIVAITSQLGGFPLTSSSVTSKGGDYRLCHIKSCQNTVVQNRVLELLSTTDGNLFSKGFGKVDNLKYNMDNLTWENILRTYPVNGIIDVDDLYSRYYNKLTDPMDKLAFENWRRGNQTSSPSNIRRQSENSDVMESSYLTLDHNFVEGDSVITIKINSVGDFTNISFGCFYDGIPICMAQSDEGIVRLPDKIKGDVVIMYEGLCSDGSWWTSADTITVNTIGNTHINKIEFAQNSMLIINNEYLSPSVICTWSDGMVTEAENPTLSVANGNLAYIEENKYVYGKNPGYTKLTASYNDLTCSAPLEVLFTRDTEQRIAEKDDDGSISVCSASEFEFKQKSVMTRQAFRGILTINNNHPSMPLLNLRLHLEVRDEKGKLATEKEFQISPEALNGDFEGELDFDSGWNLKGQGTGVATILFIPTKNASPTEPKLWYFGGTLSYTDPFSGLTVNHALRPVGLTVNPSPVLDLTYFLQRDALGDDPLTPQFEPSQPTEFALLINNKGYGDAKNLKFVTQKPQVMDNEKGLKINLDMVSAQLNGEETALMLDDNNPTEFGTIPARSQAYAQWWLQSSLLGHFIEYDVNATHVTSLGNEELSLLDQVSIHELIHGFTPEPMDQDSLKRGFLVNDVEDSQDLPDRIYFTDGSNQPSYIASDATIVKQSSSNYLLTITPLQQGWVYGAVNDPLEGKMIISKIVRQSDGKEMPVDNFWQTDRTLRDGKKPLYENMLHFIVNLSATSEQYLLTFAPKPDLELAVEAYEGVPEEGVNADEPIETIQVRFNKPIDETSFTTEDIKLFHNGTAINASVIGISKVDAQTFSLSLGSTTAQDGLYVLIVQTADITDAEGFAGAVGKEVSWVQACKPDPKLPIVFADAEVKRICVENWDSNGDGELSYGEAAAVTDIGQVFRSNRAITNFKELAYFTGLTEIPENAFNGCYALQSIVIPEACTAIGRSSFWNCEKLQSINIPAAVNSIAQVAFGYCSDLARITVSSENETYDSRYDCNGIIQTATNTLIAGCKNTTIPNDIVCIGEFAFRGITSLNEITIPHSVTSIGRFAFIGCNLASIIIPSSVTSITDYTFSGRTMTSIVVEDGNPVYDSREGCNAIIETATNTLVLGCQTTKIPSSIKKIGDYSFVSLKTLVELIIPEGVSSIGSQAFAYSPLTMVSLPKTLEEIGDYNFYGCNDLLTIYSNNPQPPVMKDNSIFVSNSGDQDAIFQNAILYVPKGSKSAYQEANVWKDFKQIMELEPGDANGDGKVTIADVTATINFILDTEGGRLVYSNADMNQDHKITTDDVKAIVKMILGK